MVAFGFRRRMLRLIQTKTSAALCSCTQDFVGVPLIIFQINGNAQPILEEMADIDKGIAQIKEDLKKYGNAGFDVTTGMKYSVAYVEDRNAQVQELQKKKVNLQKKLEDLEEEGRKAGAQPAWFR